MGQNFKQFHDIVLYLYEGGGLSQWLGRRISDQGVPGSSPGLAPLVVALSKSHLPIA